MTDVFQRSGWDWSGDHEIPRAHHVCHQALLRQVPQCTQPLSGHPDRPFPGLWIRIRIHFPSRIRIQEGKFEGKNRKRQGKWKIIVILL